MPVMPISRSGKLARVAATYPSSLHAGFGRRERALSFDWTSQQEGQGAVAAKNTAAGPSIRPARGRWQQTVPGIAVILGLSAWPWPTGSGRSD